MTISSQKLDSKKTAHNNSYSCCISYIRGHPNFITGIDCKIMMMSNDIMEYSFQSKCVVGGQCITMPVPMFNYNDYISNQCVCVCVTAAAATADRPWWHN